jgi:error-prone DNA polymerase
MGFYSPQSLVADARRHGVEVRRPDLHLSGVDAGLEQLADGQELTGRTGFAACHSAMNSTGATTTQLHMFVS